MARPPRPYGTGPGAIAPDGCAVDLYAQLPDYGEPAIVHEAAGAGASILELGCGAGRVTHPLAALGHEVVAVDESPEMLARIRGAETVCARIEDLRLGRRFGAVLLASHLINADDETRSALLAACRRHVAHDGCVIVQQHAPEWFSALSQTEITRDGVIYRMLDVSRPAPNQVSATVVYLVGDNRWTQTFTATRLDETELATALAAAGLRLDRYLTEDRSWFRAVPASVASRDVSRLFFGLAGTSHPSRNASGATPGRRVLRLSWWIRALRLIRCTGVPPIHRQARINRRKQRT